MRASRSSGATASRRKARSGDGDPLQAIEDALRTFGADEIVISTHPEGRSHWLERNVVGAARDRFDVPITHVVVDLDAWPRQPATPERTCYLPAFLET